MADDIVARAKLLLSQDLCYAPNRDVKLLIEELCDELEDERGYHRFLAALVQEYRDTETWNSGKSQ